MVNEYRNYGLKFEEKDPEAYVLGGLGALPRIVLEESGQWDRYLPKYEPQYNSLFDSYGCTVWGWQNLIEIMLEQRTGVERNFSERFTYILAKITPPGADPHHVAEVIRNNGLINNDLLPMTSEMSFLEFLRPNPMAKELVEEGLTFGYELKHEYVFQNVLPKEERTKLMKEALRYSPLGVSVTAWYLENGLYVDKGQPNSHWCVLYGWNDKGWLIFDSYDQSTKTLSYDHKIQVCKRAHLEPSVRLQQISIIQRLINAIKALIGLMPTVVKKNDRVHEFCMGIRQHEGWYEGSRSWRNNNPGNVKYSPVGYLPIYGTVLKDKDNFAIFKDYETGWLYLNNLIKAKCTKFPNQTILEFINIYAPSSDGNDPFVYARFLADKLGVDITYQLKDIWG